MARKKEQIKNEELEKTENKEDVQTDTKTNKKTSTTDSKKSKKKESSKKPEEEKAQEVVSSVDDVEDKEDTDEKKSSKKTKDKKKDKKKKDKKKIRFGPIEFAFNFISIVFVLCVAFYYGGRSLYFYSLQNQSKKETAMTLNGLLLDNNKLVKGDADGLHQDSDGYFFKGKVENNYVWFGNRLFRVMRISEDNNVKLVTDDLVSSFMWGESSEYTNSNVRTWLTKVDGASKSGIYYDTIPAPSRFLTDTKYYIDHLVGDRFESGDIEFKDNVTTLTLGDYITAGGKNSYLNNGKLYFLLGYTDTEDNLYVEEDGNIVNCGNYDGFGIRGVITLNKNIPISQGDGTRNNPYMIDQGSDTNYVDSYVKLGEDIWKVYEDSEGILKMYLNGYIKVDGEELYKNYSYRSNTLNFFDYNNIGYYLYNEYINSLSYRDYLTESIFPYGEMSDETGYNFTNIYSNTYHSPIGMLNLFDYVSNNELSDFFRGNTGARMSTTQYSVLSNGMVSEAEVTDYKHIVPVVSMKSEIIKAGNGRIDNPYVVE